MLITDVANGILMITCFIIALPILFFQAGGFEGMAMSFENKGMPNNMSLFGVLSYRDVINFTLPSFLLILGDANMYQRFLQVNPLNQLKRQLSFYFLLLSF